MPWASFISLLACLLQSILVAGGLSTHVCPAVSHPLPVQSLLPVPIWTEIEKAHMAPRLWFTSLDQRRHGDEVSWHSFKYYTCEYKLAKLVSWVANNIWLGKLEGFSALCFCTAPSPEEPSPRQVICWRPPPLLKHHVDCDSVLSLIRLCWKSPPSAKKISSRATSKLLLWADPSVAACTEQKWSSWSGEAHIGCIFLCSLASYNAKKQEDTRVLLRERTSRGIHCLTA